MSKTVNYYMQNARPLRELHGFSQAYVAFRIGVSQSFYCKAENGQVRPTFSLAEGICSLYGISIADFISKSKKDLLGQIMDSDTYKRNMVGI